MELYTTYFANLKRLPKDIVPISISIHPPKGYSGLEYRKLAPSNRIYQEYILTKRMDPVAYEHDYKEQVLNLLKQEQVIQDIMFLSKGKSAALVCYESPEKFCHRHLLSPWLQAAGYQITEYKPPVEEEMENFSLFD